MTTGSFLCGYNVPYMQTVWVKIHRKLQHIGLTTVVLAMGFTATLRAPSTIRLFLPLPLLSQTSPTHTTNPTIQHNQEIHGACNRFSQPRLYLCLSPSPCLRGTPQTRLITPCPHPEAFPTWYQSPPRLRLPLCSRSSLFLLAQSIASTTPT